MTLTPDARILFATRAVRTFAYGLLAVILALYLAARGFSDEHIGLIFTLTLVGDAVLSLGIAGVADRMGRRRVLVASCVLVVVAGVVFVTTESAIVLTLAAVIGTISPSGAEVGPFLSIEQAAISQQVDGRDRTRAFGYYQLAGSLSSATGALTGGWIAQRITTRGHADVDAYRAVILLYAALGVVMAALFLRLSPGVEPAGRARARGGLHRSRRAVTTLAALFTLDSFGSGLAVQTLLAYWLHRRFGADVGVLGGVFFATNVVAGFSSLLSAPIARRFGLVNTMVWTHVPGNMLLIAFPFMPTLETSVAALLGRFLVAQMDVPARTSYMMAIVDDDERSAASALANQAKLVGSSLGPFAAGLMGMSGAPFVVAGALKIAYDLALYRLFRRVRPPGDAGPREPSPPPRGAGDP
ncbi:MAG: MFS transporter [Labilithrix sp.]|nr:MFS transporter [Labilithrix sp.]MCW5835019.1 MFS transporter [Labilithrix sp.]